MRSGREVRLSIKVEIQVENDFNFEQQKFMSSCEQIYYLQQYLIKILF